MKFGFSLPVNVLFGPGSSALLPSQLAALGVKKPLLVTGRSSARTSGLLDMLIAALRKEGIDASLFAEVAPDPDTILVDRGISAAKENGCDAIVGIGGGSAIDCAKAIAALAPVADLTSSADYLEIDGTKGIDAAGLPFIALPTIAGTGAEVTKNAVLVNPATRAKRSIRHPSLFARICIVDPSLMASVPPHAAAAAGIDAFCHLLEGYTSAKATAFTDMLAFEGLARLKYSLLELYHDPANAAAREDLAFAALLGGMVIANGGLTLAHGVGSVIGPRFGIPHGLACVLPLEGIMRHNWPCLDETKQTRLKSLLQDNVPEDIRSLLSGLDLTASLSEFGINARDLEEIACQSLATSSAKGNPCPCSQDELVEILKEKL